MATFVFWGMPKGPSAFLFLVFFVLGSYEWCWCCFFVVSVFFLFCFGKPNGFSLGFWFGERGLGESFWGLGVGVLFGWAGVCIFLPLLKFKRLLFSFLFFWG